MASRPSRRGVRLLLALLLAIVLTACPLRRAQTPAAPAMVELALAVSTGCPQGTLSALSALCGSVREISGGTIRLTMTQSGDPLSAEADAAFVLSDRLAAASPGFAALGEPLSFRSAMACNEALNTCTALDAMAKSLGPGAGVMAYAAFYCGRTVLLTNDSALGDTFATDDEEDARAFGRIIRGDGYGIEAAQFSPPQESLLVSMADTATLARVPAEEKTPFILIDALYRYQAGVLFISDALPAKAGAPGYAAVLEAVARAKPINDEAARAQDNAATSGFSRTVTLTERQRRIIRETLAETDNALLEPAREDPMRRTALYRALENYIA